MTTDEILVPLALATGCSNPQEAMMMLAYRGAAVVTHGKDVFLRLSAAIQWNEAEAADASSRAEHLYRAALAKHLKGCAESVESIAYTSELWGLWARVFEDDAKALVSSSRKDIPPDLREIVRKAVH